MGVRPNMDISKGYAGTGICAKKCNIRARDHGRHTPKRQASKKSEWFTARYKVMADNLPPLALHRCRFVDTSPSPITALAFPPLPLPSVTTKAAHKQREYRDRGPEFGTLVVGHANGNIDLLEWTGALGELQASQAWHHRKVGLPADPDPCTQIQSQTLPGPRPSKVDSLALTIRYPDMIHLATIPSSSDLRLFSSGGGSELLEWDITRSIVRVCRFRIR